jgi:hypothetical protein
LTVVEASAGQYHADALTDEPTLSATTARILCTQTPAHAREQHPRLNPNYRRAEEQKFDIGNACHRLLLEGEDCIHIVAAPDWRSNFAKEQRDFGREYGRIPLLESQWLELEAMVAALRAQFAHLEADPPVFTDGKPEQVIVWDEQGVKCRARLDWLRDDLTGIDDLKTTGKSADPRKWGQHTLFGMGYDVQAAFYRRAVRSLGGDPEFRFVVAEVTPPFLCSVVDLAPDALALADDKIDYALNVWKRCLAEGRWDGYDRRTFHAEAPAWASAQWFERQGIEEVAA